MRVVSTMFVAGLLLMVALVGVVGAQEQAQDQKSQVAERMMTDYYLLVGDYFDVPYEYVSDVIQTGLTDDEIPVAFFIADKANVSPVDVAKQRVEGKHWYFIYTSYDLAAGNFWVDFDAKDCQRIFNRLSKLNKGQWTSKLVLKDAEVINLINLRIMKTIYPKAEENIAVNRSLGRKFAYIQLKEANMQAYEVQLQLAAETEE